MYDANRREFLKVALAGLAMGRSVIAAEEKSPSGIPMRPLGRTGEKVTIIALGGWHIGSVDDDQEAIAIMQEAVDQGLTFFDNCWDYHNGHSEELMGRALATGGRRDKVFLMTKVCARDYKGALKHLDDSLRRMKTDHLDLWQFHGTKWDDDADLIFDEKNGAMKAALEAKRAGKIRYIGFTGHKDPKYHQAFLNKPFDWDTVQMPVNIVDAHYRSFQKTILPECTKRNISVIGMKGLASQDGRLVRELGLSAEVCRRYALSLPVTALVCGITSRENLRQDLDIARNFKPMTEAEVTELAAQSRKEGSDGRIEAYKTGNFGCDWHHRQTEGS